MTETTAISAYYIAREIYMAVDDCTFDHVRGEESWQLTIGTQRLVIGDEPFEDEEIAGWSWTEYMWAPELGLEGEWEDVATDGCLVESGADYVRDALRRWADRATLALDESK